MKPCVALQEAKQTKSEAVRRDNNEGRRKSTDKLSHLETNSKARSGIKNKADVKTVERYAHQTSTQILYILAKQHLFYLQRLHFYLNALVHFIYSASNITFSL